MSYLFLYEGVVRFPGLPLLDSKVLLRKTIKFFITSKGVKYRQKSGKQPNVMNRNIASYLDLETVMKLETQESFNQAVGSGNNMEVHK